MMHVYETRPNRDKIMFHRPTKTWFAYAWSRFQNECVRGKGKTEQEAIENSIKNTLEDK